MTILPYNLHSHTKRCGHAFGEDEEYVLAAIEAGFTELGFSDHVMLPSLSQPGIRGDFSLLEDYISSINELKRKYADRILIHVGFEAEWYGKELEGYYRELLARPDFEYLILGQHCFHDTAGFHWYADLPQDVNARRYTSELIAGMESGLFTYVAHPDWYTIWLDSFGETSQMCAHHIAEAAQRLRLPLELNCGPLRRIPKERWSENVLQCPCPAFWDIVSQYDVDVVIGVDAHDPKNYAVTEYALYMEFAKKHNLRLLFDSPLSPFHL